MDDNFIRLFDDEQIDDESFRSTLREFAEHVRDGNDIEDTCRNYMFIATNIWIGRVGYDEVRENLFGLIVALDERHVFD